MTAEDRKLLEIIHTMPRAQLEALLDRLDLLESFKEVEKEARKA